jgi:signal transduction histidine kinase
VANYTIRRPILSYVTPAISLTCHGLFVLLYLLRYDAGPSFTKIDAQVSVLGTLLVVGVVVSFFVEARLISRLILLIRFLCYLWLCMSFPPWFDIRLFLLAAFTFEIGIYEPYPMNLIMAGVAAIASFVLIEVVNMVTIGVNPEVVSRALIFAVLPATVGVTACYVTGFRERHIESENDNDRLNIAVSQLSRSNLLLQDAAFTAAEQSKKNERHRVTREIHDTVGYTLTNLIMMMEAATDLVFEKPDELQRIMQAARDQAKSGLEETRRSLRELREYEEPPIKGLAAIEKLVSSYDHVSSVQVEVEYGNAPMTFGEEIDYALFHFVQEGLTNALRHGKATHLGIRLWIEAGVLSVIIRDNGRGATTMTEGIGFSGMRERAERLGGHIDVGNVADGFQAVLSVPYQNIRKEVGFGENTRTTRR